MRKKKFFFNPSSFSKCKNEAFQTFMRNGERERERERIEFCFEGVTECQCNLC